MPWSFWAALVISVFVVLDMLNAKKASDEKDIAKTVYWTGMAIISALFVLNLLQPA